MEEIEIEVQPSHLLAKLEEVVPEVNEQLAEDVIFRSLVYLQTFCG